MSYKNILTISGPPHKRPFVSKYPVISLLPVLYTLELTIVEVPTYPPRLNNIFADACSVYVNL